MISTAMKIISFERYWRRYGRETRFEYLIRAGSVENYSNFKCKQYYSLIIFPPGMGSLRFLRRFFQFILLAKGWQDNVRDDRPIYDWTERIGNSSAYCWISELKKSHNNNRDNTYPLVESTGEKQNKLPWTLSGYLFKEIKNKLLVGY